jgi:hypothetical protein
LLDKKKEDLEIEGRPAFIPGGWVFKYKTIHIVVEWAGIAQ